MKQRAERGAINVLLIPVIVLMLLFVGTLIFAFWAYGGRQDYKDNSDQKTAAAVAAAIKAEDAKKDAQFAEEAKSPFKTYSGPSAYGSLKVVYPKTWSGYVDESGNGNANIDGYFNPGVVPAIDDQSSVFALRVQVVNQSYSDALQQHTGDVQDKVVTSRPYRLPKVPSVIGTRLEGQIDQNKNGIMIILPLRNQTLQIWTEATKYEPDFTKYILPNLRFSP